MDEMADTVELFAAGRSATAPGLGAVHDSGGERALLIDTADRVSVPIPVVSEVTAQRLAGVLDSGLEPTNPVDAWGTGRDSEAVFVECLLALAEDSAVGALAFCVDLTPEELPDEAYSRAAFTVAGRTGKPVAVLCNMATTVDPIQAGYLRDEGVPVLEGTETGLRALKHLLAHHQRSSLPALGDRLSVAAVGINELEGEVAAFGLLAAYGIPTPTLTVVDDQEGLLAAAAEIGYPLVLKTAESIDHKTDVDGVRIGIVDEAGLLDVYRDLSSRLGPRVIVSEQIVGGVEIGLGMVTDEQFGPVILVSAGGTLIELMSDRVALLPRLDKMRALRALNRLEIRPLLDGARGAAPVDIDALAELIARFSELASDRAASIDSIDVNPVIAGPAGAVAVDVLIKGRG
jgi:acyl-CoA synthetase (NDP forming)